MHPNNEALIQDFLQETQKILDPIERLQVLEKSEFSEKAAVKATRAWWEARYHFANRKKTRTSDRFLWFLLSHPEQCTTIHKVRCSM